MSTRDEIISGGAELDDLLRTLPAKMHRNVNRAGLRAGAKVYLDEVRSRIPVVSGDLRASARITTRAKGDEVSASVKVGNAKAWYAHLVEFGTRQHMIAARERQALHFGGVEVSNVHHPGARAHPYARPAADAKFGEAVRAVTNKIRERLTREGLNTAPGGDA